MKRSNENRISPVPWALVVLLLVILAGLVVLRLFAAAEEPEPVSTPAPTAAPSPTPDPAERMLKGLTQQEKICQLLIVHPEALTGKTVTKTDETLDAALEAFPIGGVILDNANMKSREQLTALTSALQGHDMLITVDEEGGRVARLMTSVGTTWLGSMYSYRNGGTETAYQNALTIGTDLIACGFNTDFAPVADVWSNPKNTVIGDRAYSDDFDEAAELVAAAVKGFHEAGAICCLKHFPGHGSTLTDSHEGTAIVDQTLEGLRTHDLKPFVSGIGAGADLVMVGHLTVPKVDDVPACMSKKLVTDLLRKELGFDGVIITDGLQMAGAGIGTDGEKAVKCLQAGCDLLLEVNDVKGTVEAIESALDDGTLTQKRLDESVLRVLRLKMAYGIL